MTWTLTFLLLQSLTFVGPVESSIKPVVILADPHFAAEQFIGIRIQAANPIEAQRHVEYAFGVVSSKPARMVLREPVLKVNMPCGIKREYHLHDFPHSDVPCSCGKKGHWLVKYEYSHEDYRK